MDEANSIASFLGVHVKDVLKHAGVAIDLDGQPTRILLVAIIKDDCWMEMLKEPRPLPQTIIDRASSAIAGAGNGKIIAAQVRASKGQLALFDDAVMLFKHTDKFDPASVGALSIVRGREGIGLCKVLSARKTGEAVVMGKSGPEEHDILWATPVLAVIP